MTTDEYACMIPASIVDDAPSWRAFWTSAAGSAGWTPAGEPSLERKDQAVIAGVGVMFPDDPPSIHIARGPVTRP